MTFTQHYTSPLGIMLLSADETGLTGVWFEGAKYYAANLLAEHMERENAVLRKTKEWLDIYFSGKEPGFLPPLHPVGTVFQKNVWELLLEIPYGQTSTYGAIAKQLAQKLGVNNMSPQAVGGAVGHNPISLLIPCHRVVGADGNLTGYAGGMERKQQLLELEQSDVSRFRRP